MEYPKEKKWSLLVTNAVWMFVIGSLYSLQAPFYPAEVSSYILSSYFLCKLILFHKRPTEKGLPQRRRAS